MLTEGWSIHELGTARMGTDPKTSVLNQFQQSHDVKQPVRRRRQQPRQRVVPEPDLDDHGARLALVRLPGGRVQEGEPVTADDPPIPAVATLIKLGAAADRRPPRSTRRIAALRRAQPAPAAFFTPDELALVDELSEMIIPTDDIRPAPGPRRSPPTSTPGWPRPSRRRNRTDWRDGLRLVEQLSQESTGRPFMQSSSAERVAVLTRIAGHESKPERPEELFFVELKSRVVHAYYTSEIGIKQEMGYLGNVYLKDFVGTDVS